MWRAVVRFVAWTLRPVLADFSHAEREAQDFASYSRLRGIAFTRAIMALSILGILTWGWTDPFVFTNPDTLSSIIRLRIAFLVAFGGGWTYFSAAGDTARVNAWRRIVPWAIGITGYAAYWLGTLDTPEMPLASTLWIVQIGTIVYPLPPGRRALFNLALLAVLSTAFYLGRGGPVSSFDAMTVLFAAWAAFVATVLGHLVYRLERSGFDQRRKIEEHARRSDELSRLKDAFVATVSHELRTPLHAIIGLTEASLEHDLKPELRGQLGTVHDCGEVLLDLVNDILDLSQIRAGALVLEKGAVDVREVVESTTAIVATTCAEKGLALSHRVDPALPRFVGDPRRVAQIVRNLTANAVKFTDAGEVEVIASRVERDGHPWLELEVRDTGPGVPKDARERIFEEFVHLEPSSTRQHGGTGLGLAIARRLAERMGGSLAVGDNAPRGAVFTLQLPLEPAEQPPVATSAEGLWIVHASPALRLRHAVETLSMLGAEVRVAHGPTSISSMVKANPSARAVLVDDAHLAPEKLVQLGVVDACASAAVPLVVALDPRRMARAAGLGQVRRIPAPARTADLATIASSPSAPVASVSTLVQKARRRVLVVDDVRENRLVAQAYLRGTAYDAELAESAADALAKLERTPFDAVLLDIEMPHVDGFETLARIRAREREQGLSRTPVVAMTAHGAAEVQRRSKDAGFDAHLVKPTRRPAMLQVLDEITRTNAPVEPEAQLPAALAATFLEQLSADLVALGGARTPELEPMRALGHRLAGSAATFGFEELGRLGRELESAAQRGERPESQRILRELTVATGRLRAA